MRISNFIDFIKKNNKVIIFSIITKSIVELTNDEFEDLNSGIFEKFDKETIKFLLEKNIITNLFRK